MVVVWALTSHLRVPRCIINVSAPKQKMCRALKWKSEVFSHSINFSVYCRNVTAIWWNITCDHFISKPPDLFGGLLRDNCALSTVSRLLLSVLLFHGHAINFWSCSSYSVCVCVGGDRHKHTPFRRLSLCTVAEERRQGFKESNLVFTLRMSTPFQFIYFFTTVELLGFVCVGLNESCRESYRVYAWTEKQVTPWVIYTHENKSQDAMRLMCSGIVILFIC